MKFMVAKSSGIPCGGCNGAIDRGNDMVQTFIVKPGYKVTICYHALCYIRWYTDMFNRKWAQWKQGTGNIVRPHRGRPIVIKEPTTFDKLNRLRANLSYHKSKGHELRIKTIETQIARITGH